MGWERSTETDFSIPNFCRTCCRYLGVISWLAKNSDSDYDEKVKAAKLAWLNKHLNSVNFTTIHIVAYGTNKLNVCGEGILFDDELNNREVWGEGAHEPAEILNILKGLM